MLPTFVIGLREGLEAVLIVSIIATFLRRNNAPMRPLWFGLAAAVALSIGVGIVLKVVEQALPQRQQEGMETIIGLIAVCFVTAMVIWMRTHARFMKRDLEGAAADALSSGTTAALVVMVFLSVLREGFETSVFLLATFQAASSTASAAIGAVLGILVSVVLGFGIYFGGVRLNLGRFFSITSAFLILVAAGLVLSAMRTAHEAGWVTIGQATTVDLSWLAPPGSIRAALVSGVLGIPADPRVVEVLAWCCYLIPVAVLTFWPARWRPSARRQPRVRAALAVVLAVAAIALFAGVSRPDVTAPRTAPLDGGGTARVAVDGNKGRLALTRGGADTRITLTRPREHDAGGRAETTWTGRQADADRPTTLTVGALLAYTGGRVPVGLDVQQAPGPYAATWTDRSKTTVDTYGDGLVSATRSGSVLLTVTGGGLNSARVLTVDDPKSATWTVTDAYTTATESHLAQAEQASRDRTLWKYWFPSVLLAGAIALALSARRASRALTQTTPPDASTDATDASSGRPSHDRAASAASAR